jgi:hypothetical protein
MKYLAVLITLLCSTIVYSQIEQPRPAVPKSVPVREEPAAATAQTNTARKYTNPELGFEITFPVTWIIPGDDFEEYARSQGHELALKAPDTLGQVSRIRIDRALERVKVLVTAYRSIPGSKENAILRVSVEDLSLVPEVKDAVDYFDLMRSQYASMKLPPDFKYSETQAEQLGKKQFALLDTSTSAGKKRLYATVRKRVAILFTLSYTRPEDLKAVQAILASGNFDLKN